MPSPIYGYSLACKGATVSVSGCKSLDDALWIAGRMLYHGVKSGTYTRRDFVKCLSSDVRERLDYIARLKLCAPQ